MLIYLGCTIPRRIGKSGGGRADAGRKAGGGPGEDEGRQAGSRRGGAGTTAGGPQSRRDQRREAGEKSGKSLGKSKVDGKVNETMNRLRRPSAAQVTAFDCCRLQFSCCAARLPNFAAVVTTPAENSGRASIPPRISSSCSTNFSSRGIYTGWMLSAFKSAHHSRSVVACRYAFTPWVREL